jgi:hypothetical protein
MKLSVLRGLSSKVKTALLSSGGVNGGAGGGLLMSGLGRGSSRFFHMGSIARTLFDAGSSSAKLTW